MPGVGDENPVRRQHVGDLLADALGTNRHRIRVELWCGFLAPFGNELLNVPYPGFGRAFSRLHSCDQLLERHFGIAEQ
jgi:hypothetical protein